jgi:iron complex transport system substrate-binding protein
MLWLTLMLFLTPHRIVSTAPGITEILFALGAGDQVVGDTTYCNYPEAAKSKAKIGGFRTPNLEAILALRPDVVFTRNDHPDLVRDLRYARIEAVELRPDSVAGIYRAVQTIAEKLGVPERGRELISSLDKQIHRPLPTTNRRPTVLFMVGRRPGIVADVTVVGHGSFLDELIELAGGVNLAGNITLPYPKFSLEEIFRLNPDVIFDMGHNEVVPESQKQVVKQVWQKYPFLRAVQRDAVYPISADYFITPSPRIAQAVKDLREMTWK